MSLFHEQDSLTTLCPSSLPARYKIDIADADEEDSRIQWHMILKGGKKAEIYKRTVSKNKREKF
jgi:hypothetical protein